MTAQLLRRKRIYNVDVPPETIEAWEDKLDKDKRAYERYFKNARELEFFCMLPLDNSQRTSLLKTLADAREEELRVSRCKGEPGNCRAHRLLCMSCVLRHRPSCAVPYH